MSTTLYFFQHSALSFVREQDSKLHAHRAAQLTLALDGEFKLQRDGEWQSLCFAYFAPEQPHRIVSGVSPLAFLFVDPGPRIYASWIASGHTPAPPSQATLDALRELSVSPSDPERAADIAAQWEHESLPELAHRTVEPDPRVEQALAAIERDPTRPTNHRELAALAHLSVSRFAERFRLATGMPVRNYLLWRRLLQSVLALQSGISVTQAAHDAGFADAAHLSRSFRRILGAMPSDLGPLRNL